MEMPTRAQQIGLLVLLAGLAVLVWIRLFG